MSRSRALSGVSWVRAGTEAIVESGVAPFPVESERRFALSGENDHWSDIRSGALKIVPDEAGPEDVSELHEDEGTIVYYTDGAAAYGRGGCCYGAVQRWFPVENQHGRRS